jgi:hypothetical protein
MLIPIFKASMATLTVGLALGATAPRSPATGGDRASTSSIGYSVAAIAPTPTARRAHAIDGCREEPAPVVKPAASSCAEPGGRAP